MGKDIEGSTINDIVTKLRKKFNIRRFIFVGDRGLFSKKNLEMLRGEGKIGEFIARMKLGIFKEQHKEFYNINQYTWVNDDLAFYETTHDGDRFCHHMVKG